MVLVGESRAERKMSVWRDHGLMSVGSGSAGQLMGQSAG